MTQKNIGIRKLMATLDTAADLPLLFFIGDTSINPGYHVTEVRHAEVNSLDCGKGADQWQEITVQLLDGAVDSAQKHMLASKFLAIIGTALKSLPAEAASMLYFEFAPGNGPLQKLSIDSVCRDSAGTIVVLAGERSACKPLQRSKTAGEATTARAGATVSVLANGCCSNRNNADRVVTACCE